MVCVLVGDTTITHYSQYYICTKFDQRTESKISSLGSKPVFFIQIKLRGKGVDWISPSLPSFNLTYNLMYPVDIL